MGHFKNIIQSINHEGLGEDTKVDDLVGERDTDIDLEITERVELETNLDTTVAKLEDETEEYIKNMDIEESMRDDKEFLEESYNEAEYLNTEVNQETLLEHFIKLNHQLQSLNLPILNYESNDFNLLDKYTLELNNLVLNNEGLLASIMSGIGSTMLSLEKLVRSKKSYLQSLLQQLLKLKVDPEQEDEERFNNKYSNLKPSYMVYIDADNTLLEYLEGSLKMIQGGIKKSFDSLPKQKLPSKLNYIEENIEKDLRSKFSKDDNILPDPDNVELEYQDYKITGIYSTKKYVVAEYAIKYNRGVTYHTYQEELEERIKMKVDVSDAINILRDAIRNVDNVSRLLKQIKDQSVNLAKLHAEKDNIDSKWYRKMFLDKYTKYKDIVNNYYRLVEIYPRFIIREIAHRDNKDIESKIADTSKDIGSSIGKGVSKVVNTITGRSNNYDY